MKHIQPYGLFESVMPKVWYHGTDQKFAEFEHRGQKGPSAFGVWFSDDPEFATMFGENVMKARLDIKNPYTISQDKWDSIRDQYAKDTEWFKRWREELIAKGHDCLFIKERKQSFAGSTVRDPNIVGVLDLGIIKMDDDKKANTITNESSDPLASKTTNKWKQGGIVLIYGMPLEDGTRRLYAAHIKRVLQYDRFKKGDEYAQPTGQAAKMVLLDDDTYRIIDDGRKLKAAKVLGGDKAIGAQGRRIVLNNQKTPLHWRTLTYEFFPALFRDMQMELRNLPNIRWYN